MRFEYDKSIALWSKHINTQHVYESIAQVEGYLKEATEESRDVKGGKTDGNQDSDDGTKSRPRAATATDEEDGAALDEQTPCIPPGHFIDPNHFAAQAESGDGLPFEASSSGYLNGKQYSNDELIDLSMSETLPPLEVIEELYVVLCLVSSSSFVLTRLMHWTGMNASLLRSTTTCRLYNLAAITRPFMAAL